MIHLLQEVHEFPNYDYFNTLSFRDEGRYTFSLMPGWLWFTYNQQNVAGVAIHG